MNPLGSSLPDDFARQAKLAPVPLYLRSIFSTLPEHLALDAAVGGSARDLPLAARQLVKLSLISDQLGLREASPAPFGEPLRLTVSRAERSYSPTLEELGRGITYVARRILESLFTGPEFSGLIERLAFQSSNLATLRSITNFMLESTDVDQALYIMLSGITSGYSLGFNRVALFIWDEERQVLRGSKAIGPYDETEAHRIWEAIEYEDKNIEALIADYANRRFDTRFQQHVQGIELRPSGLPDDEVSLALTARDPVRFRQAVSKNPGLARLAPGGEFIFAVLKPHGSTLGLIFADNRYNRAPISPDQLGYFGFFIDQTALVWENLALLERVAALARQDALTGVLSRRELESRMATELARCQRHERPCSLIVADIDFFKQVNDRGGHAAGDEMLRRLGFLLRCTMRADDVVGRWGGDEFVVLMPETRRESAVSAAERLGRLARQMDLSLSIGVAAWPRDCAQTSSLFETADASLYRAKAEGRGRLCAPGEPALRFADADTPG